MHRGALLFIHLNQITCSAPRRSRPPLFSLFQYDSSTLSRSSHEPLGISQNPPLVHDSPLPGSSSPPLPFSTSDFGNRGVIGPYSLRAQPFLPDLFFLPNSGWDGCSGGAVFLMKIATRPLFGPLRRGSPSRRGGRSVWREIALLSSRSRSPRPISVAGVSGPPPEGILTSTEANAHQISRQVLERNFSSELPLAGTGSRIPSFGDDRRVLVSPPLRVGSSCLL